MRFIEVLGEMKKKAMLLGYDDYEETCAIFDEMHTINERSET